MSKYQVAIIGTNIGAKHFEDFQKVSDKFNVHTVCGLTKDSIENILPTNSDTNISLNFEDVLKIKEIDIVDICLPPHLHFSACKKSLEAGKHVICARHASTHRTLCNCRRRCNSRDAESFSVTSSHKTSSRKQNNI